MNYNIEINRLINYINKTVKDMQTQELSTKQASVLIDSYNAKLKAIELLMQTEQQGETAIFDIVSFNNENDCEILQVDEFDNVLDVFRSVDEFRNAYKKYNENNIDVYHDSLSDDDLGNIILADDVFIIDLVFCAA